jgi:hypothetical protein
MTKEKFDFMMINMEQYSGFDTEESAMGTLEGTRSFSNAQHLLPCTSAWLFPLLC